MPYRMDGSVGPSGEKVLAFKKRLERDLYQVEIALEDERLSTYEAEQPMIEAGIRDRRKRKETVDQLAASIILQAYLDRKRSEASLPGSKTE
ncbi:MAG: Holliday junction resolvase RuvX, partial [Lachnospiraceae bacterium]|nr:Holliday junction resolvase RuvX [Lachnospiraceae bacterium]